MENSDKSRVTAGLLGVFLGGFGIHNFYLGERTKGIAKLILTLVGGFIYFSSMMLLNFATVILSTSSDFNSYLGVLLVLSSIATISMILGGLLWGSSALWGFIEGMLQLTNNKESQQKSRIGATIFALTLGIFGAHNFYLGYKNKAIAQLLITILGSCLLIGPLASWIWSFTEGIGIISGKIKVDATGTELRE